MKQLISDAETTITHIQEDSSKVADEVVFHDRVFLTQVQTLLQVWLCRYHLPLLMNLLECE
jgi:hypothetical protein